MINWLVLCFFTHGLNNLCNIIQSFFKFLEQSNRVLIYIYIYLLKPEDKSLTFEALIFNPHIEIIWWNPTVKTCECFIMTMMWGKFMKNKSVSSWIKNTKFIIYIILVHVLVGFIIRALVSKLFECRSDWIFWILESVKIVK